MEQVGARPVQYGHEVVADAMNAFGRQVAQAFLVDFNLVVTVRTAILDGLYDRQALDHTPAHAVRFDIFTQVANLFARPDFTKGYVVQGSDNALDTDLSQHGKGNLVLLAKPSPCSFHNVFVLVS